MGSLQFGNQPLSETAVRLISTSGLNPSFEDLIGLAQQDWGAPPEVAFASVGQQASLVRLSLGDDLLLHLRWGDLEVKLTRTTAACLWGRHLPSPYPRYARLRRAAELVTRAFPQFRPQVVNMTYITSAAENEWKTLVKVPEAPYFADWEPIEFNQAGRGPAGVECRIQVQNSLGINGEPLSLIAASGGLKLEGEDPIQQLDLVHDELQNFFESVITDNAKERWQLVRRHS